MPCEIGRRWSFLNRSGNTAFELACTVASEFSEGLAGVVTQWVQGYIDTDGDWAIGIARIQETHATSVSSPIAYYIDRHGEIIWA